MNIYAQQFSPVLEAIAEALDIPESHYELAIKRYESIGTWLERDGSIVAPYTPLIYPQGSFLLGTVTRPISEKDEYDLDLVSELNLLKNSITQADLKKLIGHEIKSYANAHDMKSPVKEGRRCWTLHYADGVQFHIDILPSIPDAKLFKELLKSRGYSPSNLSDLAIAITDNTLPNYNCIDPDWHCSNPRGYASWFRSQMEIRFNEKRKSLAESRQLRVEEVPEYKVKTSLQRAVQILKRHRDVLFANAPDDKPISIIISTLAGHAYNNEPDILATLQNVVAGMPRYIQRNNGVVWIPNPVNPLENFADKWAEHPQREENFYKWLSEVQKDLNTALGRPDIQRAAESLKSRLGKQVIDKGLQNFHEAQNRSAAILGASASKPLKETDSKGNRTEIVTPRKPFAW